MKPTPQASCSRLGSNRPLGSGTSRASGTASGCCAVIGSLPIVIGLEPRAGAAAAQAIGPRQTPLAPTLVAPIPPCGAEEASTAMRTEPNAAAPLGRLRYAAAASPSPGSDGLRSATSGPRSGGVSTPSPASLARAAGCLAAAGQLSRRGASCTRPPAIKDSIADLIRPAKVNCAVGKPVVEDWRSAVATAPKMPPVSARRRRIRPTERHAGQRTPALRNLAVADHRGAGRTRQPPLRHGPGERRRRLLERGAARGAGPAGDRALRGRMARDRGAAAQALFGPLAGARVRRRRIHRRRTTCSTSSTTRTSRSTSSTPPAAPRRITRRARARALPTSPTTPSASG